MRVLELLPHQSRLLPLLWCPRDCRSSVLLCALAALAPELLIDGVLCLGHVKGVRDRPSEPVLRGEAVKEGDEAILPSVVLDEENAGENIAFVEGLEKLTYWLAEVGLDMGNRLLVVGLGVLALGGDLLLLALPLVEERVCLAEELLEKRVARNHIWHEGVLHAILLEEALEGGNKLEVGHDGGTVCDWTAGVQFFYEKEGRLAFA